MNSNNSELDAGAAIEETTIVCAEKDRRANSGRLHPACEEHTYKYCSGMTGEGGSWRKGARATFLETARLFFDVVFGFGFEDFVFANPKDLIRIVPEMEFE